MQRLPGARWQFCLQFLIHSTSPVNTFQNCITVNFQKSKNPRYTFCIGNSILNTRCEFHYDDVTVTLVINIIDGDIAVQNRESQCAEISRFTTRCYAERGYAFTVHVCRLSVRPSVCLTATFRYRDHISWNTS